MNDVTRLDRGLRSALALALPITLVACMGGGGRGATEPRAAQPLATLSDAEIAAVLDVANRGEVQQARLASQRAEDTSVRGYATAIAEGHSAAAREQQGILVERGITPRETEISRELAESGAQALQTLQGLSGEEFDRAYMDIQRKQHRRLLTMLDTELIPNADDPQYRTFLQELRGNVAQHLADAERVRVAPVG